MNDDELKLGMLSLAVHEAGHAVVGWRCGLHIEYLKLEYGWFTGDLLGGHNRVRGQWIEEEAMNWAATTAAGAVAQERYLLEVGFEPSLASRIAVYGGSLDADDMIDMVKEFGVSPATAHSRASRIIDANWELVVAVGTLLDDRGRLTGTVAK